MNCQNFETIVIDLARMRIMDSSVKERALAHSGECETCSQRLDDERALSLGLQALAAEMKSVSASDRVEVELLTAFRNLGVQPRPNTAHRWHYWAAAAAAVLLLVFGISALRSRMAQPDVHEQAKVDSGPPAIHTSSSPAATSSALAVESLTRPGAAIRTNRSARTRSRARELKDRPVDIGAVKDSNEVADTPSTGNPAVPANHTEREVATSFIPVGYASPMAFQDGGQLVRVELPRSAMASFGLPVNLARANERVKADVLVGYDGQARAIRFVQ